MAAILREDMLAFLQRLAARASREQDEPVRLATISTDDGTRAAVLLDGSWHRLEAPDAGALLRQPDWRNRVEEARTAPTVADPTFQTVVPHPAKVICCGHNYTGHIREMGHPLPEYPTLFGKFADTLCGPTDDISIDGAAEMVDWEAELAVVVGAVLHRANEDEAAAGIAGYTVANDISMRDWQRRTPQWLQGKAFDKTTPLGPVLVTPDEFDPNEGWAISCSVNGVLMQEGNTADLVFSAPALVSYVSQFTTLRPGDVILTGTPAGVGAAMTPPRFLSAGDVVVTSVENIGSLTNTIRA